MVQSVLTSLPMHYLCSLKIPKTIVKSFDRARRHCLWAKADGVGTPHSLAAWNLVCRPKKKGGLGVMNLELQNKALLIKHLYKFFCHHDTPWVKLVWSLYEPGPPHAQTPRGSFWWRDIFKLIHTFRSITTSTVGNGESTLYWKDFWHGQTLMCDSLPHLYSYVLEEDTSVADMCRMENIEDNFALPLSAQAYGEYVTMIAINQQVHLDNAMVDDGIFPWGNSYTAKTSINFHLTRSTVKMSSN